MMENDIDSIKKRNERVEADKAWETSNTRRAIITVFTYLIIVFFLILIDAPNPYLNALVPTTGYVLSTLTLPFLKNIWIKKIYKKY